MRTVDWDILWKESKTFPRALTDAEKESIIAQALETEEGRIAQDIARKILGPMTLPAMPPPAYAIPEIYVCERPDWMKAKTFVRRWKGMKMPC